MTVQPTDLLQPDIVNPQDILVDSIDRSPIAFNTANDLASTLLSATGVEGDLRQEHAITVDNIIKGNIQSLLDRDSEWANDQIEAQLLVARDAEDKAQAAKDFQDSVTRLERERKFGQTMSEGVIQDAIAGLQLDAQAHPDLTAKELLELEKINLSTVLASSLEDYHTDQLAIEAEFNKLDISDSLVSNIFDIAAAVLAPGNDIKFSKDIGKAILGKDKISFTDLSGEIYLRIKKELAGKTGQEKRDFAKKIVDELNKNRTFFYTNDFLKLDGLTETFSREMNLLHQDDEEGMATFRNIADGITVLASARALAKGIRFGTSAIKGRSWTNLAKKYDTKSFRALAKSVVANDTQVKAATNLTAEDVAQTIAPKVVRSGEDIPSGIGSELVDDIERMNKEAAEAIQETSQFIRRDIDINTKTYQRIADRNIKQLEKSGFNIAKSSFEVNPKTNAVDIKGVMWDDDNIKFVTKELAEARIITSGLDKTPNVTNIKIVEDTKGSFEILFDISDDFNPNKDLGGLALDGISQNGRFWLGSTNEFFDPKQITIPRSAAFSQAKNNIIIEEARQISKPLFKLKGKEFKQVEHVLRKGEKMKKEFTLSDNELLDLNYDQIRGVFASYNLNRFNHMVANQRFHDMLVNRGFKSLKAGKFSNVGKKIEAPLDIKPRGGSETIDVFDVQTNTFRSYSKDDWVFYTKSADFGKKELFELMDSYVDEGSNMVADFVLTANGTAKLTALPETTLKYLPGRLARDYVDPYFVKRVSSNKFNNSVRSYNKAEETAASFRQAEARVIEKMAALTPEEVKAGVKFEITPKSELIKDGTYDEVFFDLMRNQGRTMFSSRTYAAPMGRTDDLLESIEKEIRSVADMGAWGRHLDNMKAQFVDEFKDYINIPTDGIKHTTASFPSDKKFLVQTKGFDDPKYKKAITLWNYIDMMSRVNDPVGKKWSNLMVNTNEFIRGAEKSPLRDALGDLSLKIAKRSPVTMAKSINYGMYISAHPLRHFLLNTHQPLLVSTLRPQYALTKLLPHKAAMDTAMVVAGDKQFKGTGLKLLQKAFNLDSPSQAGELLKRYKQSGLIYDVLSGEAMANDVSLAMTSDFAKGSIFNPLKVMRGLNKGAQLGEYNNISVSWLLALDKYLEESGQTIKGILGNDAAWDEVRLIQDAFSMNMRKTGRMKWQTGWLGLATQFQTFMYKNVKAVLPEFLGGSKVFTSSEKARLAAMNMLMFGSAGFGAKGIYNEYVAPQLSGVMPDEVVKLFSDGLEQRLINNFINKVWEEDEDLKTDLDIAGSLAPLNKMLSTFAEQRSLANLALGASYQTANTFWRSGKLLSDVFRKPDVGNVQLLRESLQVAGDMLPSLKPWIRMDIELGLGAHTNASGDPIARQTVTEFYSKGLFGIKAARLEEVYKLKRNLRESERDLKHMAKEITTRITHDWMRNFETKQELSVEQWEKMSMVAQKMSVLIHQLNPADQIVVHDEISRLLTRDTMVMSSLSEMIMRDGSIEAKINTLEGMKRVDPNRANDYDIIINELKRISETK